jgi:hypothetical protein
MSIVAEDSALSRPENGRRRRMVLIIALIPASLCGALLLVLVIAPGISAAGGCGGG